MHIDVKHGMMTEKQIERIRVKITRVKRALAEDKKRWGGYYDDSAGYRYVVPGLYLKIRDYKGAMNTFRWFAKHFPDDVCYGEFLLEWALTLFKVGKLKEAERKVVAAWVSGTWVWNTFFGRRVTAEDGALDDVERDWQARQVLGYSATEKDWADFAAWVEALLSAESFLQFSAAYLNVQQRIKEEPDITKRNLLREERRAMLEGVGSTYG